MAQNLDSRPRTLNLAILVIGSVLAIACTLGPLWLVRAGVAVAVLTAVASVLLAWRQMNALVASHMAEVARLNAEHELALREADHAHHQETMETIARFNARRKALMEQIAAARAETAELRISLASSELDNEAKQTRISALNKRVADLEHELATDDQTLVNLPRRGAARRLDLSKLPLVYPTQERKQA